MTEIKQKQKRKGFKLETKSSCPFNTIITHSKQNSSINKTRRNPNGRNQRPFEVIGSNGS